ncbi:hypothetical protein Nepgr_002937 [Nepenthes gracilis]|uniref:Floricaula/leafy-like transcription factor n=1 Tax=Nepenthes gracilis TaxID=150966 RepID=A0AAD3RYJ6_NEPGR|nr:hypothetical protein Nepgr_002937 [Nepenthes gracilis]
MDPASFSANLLRWDARGSTMAPPPPNHRLFEAAVAAAAPPPPPVFEFRPNREVGGGLEEFFQAYGIRYYTAAKIEELGFTVSTLVDMKEEELDDMINSLSHIFRWELLVGERYGIKAAVRAERRRLDEEESHRRHLLSADTAGLPHGLDSLSQEGLSEEPVQQEKQAVVGGGGGEKWGEPTHGHDHRKQLQLQQRRRRISKVAGGVAGSGRRGNEVNELEENDDEEIEDQEEIGGGLSCINIERQREHPFIVTEPGEVARGKKNGLDYLFHLYELCRDFLFQVQNIAKDRGEKCPTKVTNQVFRYAKKAGATYINKPKMRHYVHCYALHCLDVETSNTLRRAFKERGENVGAWRQACYKPLVVIAARHGWDIDAIFNAHPRLSIWYVPTKLRQLCHVQRNAAAAAASSVSLSAGAPPITNHYLSGF